MTDTEKAALERRIYDRCLVRVGQLEAEKAALERRIDELCAEVEYNHQTSRSRLERIDQLKAENAKLRELVSGLEHCAGGFVCDCCPLYDPSSTNHRRCESLEQELGIEVDE